MWCQGLQPACNPACANGHHGPKALGMLCCCPPHTALGPSCLSSQLFSLCYGTAALLPAAEGQRIMPRGVGGDSPVLLCCSFTFQVSAGRVAPGRGEGLVLPGEAGLLPLALTERLCHPTALMADGGRSVMSPRDCHLSLTAPSQPQSVLQVRGSIQPQAEHSTP